jgi:hypothetical protein
MTTTKSHPQMHLVCWVAMELRRSVAVGGQAFLLELASKLISLRCGNATSR